MRILRRQLLSLLEEARVQHGLEIPPQRLQAALIHLTMRLLPHPAFEFGKKRTALIAKTLSHGAIHRHLILIRCPDQAFYLDAIKGYLLRKNILPIGQQTMVAAMQCDDQICDIQLRQPDHHSEQNFMFIALHLSATLTPNCKQLAHDIHAVLRSVELSVADFKPMTQSIENIIQHIKGDAPQDAELLAWMNEGRYLLFGMQCFDATGGNKRLGLMRDLHTLAQVTPDLHQDIQALPTPKQAGLTWVHLKSSQHHLYSAVRVDIVRICWENSANKLEYAIILGHFSRSARHANASQAPFLKQQWQKLSNINLLQHSAFYRREIRTLFDRMPKSLLASVEPELWFSPLRQVVDLTVPTHIVTSYLSPRHGNIKYLFIAMHSLRYGPNVMSNIDKRIKELKLSIHNQHSFGVGPYRIIITAIQSDAGYPTAHQIKKHINPCIIFWKDHARHTILSQAERLDIPHALHELEQLPALYQDLFPAQQFLRHYQIREQIAQHHQTMVQISLSVDILNIQVLSRHAKPLGEIIDIIQAFNLLAMQESAVEFGSNEQAIHISCIRCEVPTGLHPEAVSRLQHALEQVLNHQADHDPINALLISAGLDIEHIAVLITLRNHLIQLVPEAAPTPLSHMLKTQPKAAAAVYHMFEAIHRPAMPFSYQAQSKVSFDKAMSDVANLTDDRWLRALSALVDASLRTNAYVREVGEPLAIKINPQKLDFAPRPRPYREIFVHGVHVEGVHLRGGPISRGGIRHSDRYADFRTEVLELMSTQIVKNGQIVPTGAKGGFVVRDHANLQDPDFILNQYKQFIRSLLNLTDNLVHQECIPPDGMYIADDDHDDPYLVVAADKGTARFSDDANDEARLACFWLDDAFASGGKFGYDHKVFGITAKGAWTCAFQHLQGLEKDAYQDVISTIAIGDMGGDVFGNGMLINPNIHLLGAFNHRHIFLDPNPSNKAALERQRLFDAVKGWDAYNEQLISAGGGVFERASKYIELSVEVREILAVEATHLSGEALIKAMLMAPVALLYNGGIGTYVKASKESHADVCDPANNAVRVDAKDLRCQVVCEGGNLGFTQRARIEYAAQGGLINTDAIDNAAGVNMSDREVNLKILFAATKASSIDITKRNHLLKRMGEEVAEQCLNDNDMQAKALTVAQNDVREHPPRLLRLRDTLLNEERLDRRIDPGLHDIESLSLRPQIAVLLGHEKNRIHELLDQEKFDTWSNFSDAILENYFPSAIRQKFHNAIHQHPLRADISHTQIANHIINHMGLMSIHHLQSLLDAPISHICEALMTAEALMDIPELQKALSNAQIPDHIMQQAQHDIQEYMLHFAEELLRLFDMQSWDQTWFKQQQQGMRRFRKSLPAQGVGGNENSRFLSLLKSARQVGLELDDATHLASLPELAQMAIATYLSSNLSLPLSRCLHAMQSTLHLLPFTALETPMRSSEWGSEDAHPLRREWLNRLTILKARAAKQLLQKTTQNFLKTGEACWSQHKNWDKIQQFSMESLQQGEENGSSNEQRRMRLMLAFTQLEAIIEGV
ncbi:MAG: NAD-glutamate dehydrogenase [Mariprofundaceae bacterium]|nr:NAD-glutamate dehydrogenase [Mariprofundaceae bacterium]